MHLQVDAERTEAEGIKRVVAAEEVEVKLKQAETQHLKDDAQKDLECVSLSFFLFCSCVSILQPQFLVSS